MPELQRDVAEFNPLVTPRLDVESFDRFEFFHRQRCQRVRQSVPAVASISFEDDNGAVGLFVDESCFMIVPVGEAECQRDRITRRISRANDAFPPTVLPAVRRSAEVVLSRMVAVLS